MANVAFIGLGIMGQPMAGRLLAGGHKLSLHSRTMSRANRLIQNGATGCDSPSAAAREAEFVFICVTDTPDVEKVVSGENGILTNPRKGQVIIDHSTICPKMTKQLAEAAAQAGATFLDAPVSGGDTGAKAGTLSIMVGGDEAAFNKVEPLLKCLGKTITHCGDSGTGQLTKLVNQILVGGTLLAVSEALVFAEKNQLDGKRTLEAVGGGAAASWQLQNLGARILVSDFRPGFMIDLIQKDLRILMESASRSATALPGASLVHQLFSAAQAAGHGKEGTQALFKVLEKLSSVH